MTNILTKIIEHKKTKKRRLTGQKTLKPRGKNRPANPGIPRAWKTDPTFRRPFDTPPATTHWSPDA
jgi:hypothetical protein